MELIIEDPVFSFYNATKDSDESHIKRQQTHQIESSFASNNYQTVSLRSEDEESDCSEYILCVQNWIDDVESSPNLKAQYGYWICCANHRENYLVLKIPEKECSSQYHKTPMINDLSLFHVIREKLKENDKVDVEFKYDTYTIFSWNAISLFFCHLKWNKITTTSYNDYRLEVKMKNTAKSFWE